MNNELSKATVVELCYLGSHVHCRAFMNLGGQCVLEYYDEGSWHLGFELAGYRTLAVFLDYLVEPIETEG